MKKIPIAVKVLLTVVIATVFFIGGPILINELYKMEQGYETLWDASDMLAYYGTSLAAVLTAGSIFVAIWQYKQPLIKNIRITFTSGFTVSNDPSFDEELFYICVCNVGIRPVIITNIYFSIGKKALLVNGFRFLDDCCVEFPKKIDQEEDIEMVLSRNATAYSLRHHVANGTFSGNKRVRVCAVDTTGQRHYCKTGVKVKDIIAFSNLQEDVTNADA